MFRISQWEHENPQYYSQFGIPYHCGLDFPATTGNQIRSVKAGIVSRYGTTGNYGIHIGIDHEDGWFTLYAHLSSTSLRTGDVVTSGQVVGLSGNTGNSTGPHLHLEVRNTRFPYRDSLGIVWPYGLQPVWPSVEPLYNSWLTSRAVEGFLYNPGLVLNMGGDYARVVGSLNIRSQASASSSLLGTVTTGSVVKILSHVQNNYRRVLVVNEGSPPPPPTVRADYGLHLRADPDTPSQTEMNIVQSQLQRGGKTVKLLHNHPTNVFNQIKSYNPQYVMIRIMQHWGNRNITPEQFYQWNVDELIQKVNTLGTGITKIIEVHNEPNLYEEGFGHSWSNGFQFATWFNQTVALFKSRTELRNLQFAYPGLSPGGSIPNIRYDSNMFLTESLNAGLNADVFCCHAYWSDHYPITTAIRDVQNFKNRVPNKDLYVTEASRNDRPATQNAQQYGQEYANFVKSVNAKAVYFFVGSASNGYFEPETWVTESGQDKGINSSFLSNL